jgi:hypothetical protein
MNSKEEQKKQQQQNWMAIQITAKSIGYSNLTKYQKTIKLVIEKGGFIDLKQLSKQKNSLSILSTKQRNPCITSLIYPTLSNFRRQQVQTHVIVKNISRTKQKIHQRKQFKKQRSRLTLVNQW